MAQNRAHCRMLEEHMWGGSDWALTGWSGIQLRTMHMRTRENTCLTRDLPGN